MRLDRSLRPVLVAALGVALISGMDAVMKAVSAAYPIGEVVGLRYGMGSLFAVAVLVFAGGPRPTVPALKRNFGRALLMLCTAAAFFTAIARLPLAAAIALTFMAPLLMVLLGRLILKEAITPRALVGVGIGFLGVIVIVTGPQGGGGRGFDTLGVAAALICAFFYALSMVLMRQQSAKDSAITIVALSTVLAFVVASPVMAWQWQPPTRQHVLLFAFAGLLGTFSHLCLAWAYGRAHAGRLGILEYTALLWAATFGFLFYAEIPSVGTVIGAALIVVACLFAALGRRRAAPRDRVASGGDA